VSFRGNNMSAILYILRSSDGSYYVGATRDSLEKHHREHRAGTFDGDAASRAKRAEIEPSA